MPPGQQPVDPVDLVVGDAAENIGQPSLRIDAVELGWSLDADCGCVERSAGLRRPAGLEPRM